MMAGPLVSTAWLADHLGEPDLRVLDATWYLPHLARDARAEHRAVRVAGAVYFDIDEIADKDTTLPHMLPAAAAFGDAVGRLGVGDGDRVVVYGGRNLVASARVWWTLRAFGHATVWVLDGGLPRWRAEGRPIEAGLATPVPRRFTARRRPELVRDLAAMQANAAAPREQVPRHAPEQVVDARSAGRFAATEPEPRAGLRGGHIPGSRSLPYDRLFDAEGGLLSPPVLRGIFQGVGLDLRAPITTTCGSGATACVLAVGLAAAGGPDAAVYDGSWTEWGGRADTPVDTGA